MEIAKMTFEETETRLAEIKELMDSPESNLEELRAEVDQIEERRATIRKEEEERKALAQRIATGEEPTTIIKTFEEETTKMEEKRVFGIESEEYRNAFYAWVRGNESEEQRAILLDPISVDGNGTDDGAAIALPKTLDEKIWDNIHTAHPILADITTISSGIVMEVTKHTGIAVRVSGKKDAAATAAAEQNTFEKVVLSGVDYEKYVELTYAEAKMSQGALEDYLAEEISAELGEALAKDVFAQIDADTTSTADTSDVFADLKSALGNTEGATTIYAPSAKYYDIAAYKDNGILVNLANTLGVTLKKDDAATNIVVVNPKNFVLNEISPVVIESDRDIKKHRVVISGWMRAQGTMRNNKAGSVIK